MAYEIYTRTVRRVGSPQIAFMNNGRIGFNKAAAIIMAEQAVEYVLLLVDKVGGKVAIRPITKKDPRAYKVSIRRNNSAGFSAKPFLHDIGIDYEKGTVTYPLTWNAEQGIFEMSLRDGTLSNRKSAKARSEKPLLAAVGSKG